MHKSAKRVAIIGGAAAAIVAGIASIAVAIILISGTGTLTANAADQSKNLQVSQVQLTGSLVPGGPYVGVKAYVTNPNDFTVTVDTLRADPTGTGSLVNGHSGNYWAQQHSVPTEDEDMAAHSTPWLTAQPCHYYLNDTAANTKTYYLSTPVTLAPGQAAWLTWPKVISQDPHDVYHDTVACDVKMAVKVTGKPNGQPVNNG